MANRDDQVRVTHQGMRPAAVKTRAASLAKAIKAAAKMKRKAMATASSTRS